MEEAIAYARQRQTFGQALSHHQVIRHKLVDMMQRVVATQSMLARARSAFREAFSVLAGSELEQFVSPPEST